MDTATAAAAAVVADIAVDIAAAVAADVDCSILARCCRLAGCVDTRRKRCHCRSRWPPTDLSCSCWWLTHSTRCRCRSCGRQRCYAMADMAEVESNRLDMCLAAVAVVVVVEVGLDRRRPLEIGAVVPWLAVRKTCAESGRAAACC